VRCPENATVNPSWEFLPSNNAFNPIVAKSQATVSGTLWICFFLTIGGGISQWHSTGLRSGWSGVRFPVGTGNFLFTTASRSTLGPTQPPIEWVTGDRFLRVKRLGHEADHSPPSSAGIRNTWGYTYTPQSRFHGVVLGWSAGTNLPLSCLTL
jgi:hypothetical protein